MLRPPFSQCPSFLTSLLLLSSLSQSFLDYLGDHFCPCLFLKPSLFFPGDHLDPRRGKTLRRDSPETEAMHGSSITFYPPPLSSASFMQVPVSLHSCSVSLLYLNPSFLLCLLPPRLSSAHLSHDTSVHLHRNTTFTACKKSQDDHTHTLFV